MNKELMWLPLLAMVLLTAGVWVWTYITRVREIRRRRIRPQDLATRAAGAALLKDVAGPSDNFMNLFEMPVLFYLFVILTYVTDTADIYYLVLASIYVALRCAHSFIHVTYNRVMHRFKVYFVSSLLLWFIWVRLGWQLIERAL